MKQGNKHIKKYWSGRRLLWLSLSLILIVLWWFCLPSRVFNAPTSTVLTSKEGMLLGARIANDGQWRFPPQDSVPQRFATCIRYFEDEYFYKHPGFNPISISKALWHNITTDERRGASTLTQQVIRLSRKNQQRTYGEKLIELFQATRLEVRHTKDEILALYASHAPFGGNVVGLETAAWRYFGIPAEDLSWGQAAALAVLPNAPALIFPGKNESILRKKRNRLLLKLYENQVIDQTTYELALQERLPGKALPLPKLALHITEKARKEHPGKQITSSLSFRLQQKLHQLAEQHHHRLKQNEIHNLAVLVVDVNTKKVLAYVGNSPNTAEDPYVDIIQRPRSTGSILKPFLYTAMLDEGKILPHTLLPDVPTHISNYAPVNFDKQYRGAVPAGKALAMSLNVPAVRMLNQYGLEKFYRRLSTLHQTYINKPADYYGLSLILGGAESSLWDITRAYTGMASTLNFYTHSSSEYRTNEFKKLSYLQNETMNWGSQSLQKTSLGAGALYTTLMSMQSLNRPEGENNWQFFTNSQQIAWKTGTSHGFKDAWAVGVTQKYAVGVWVGNADGEGRPGLTGIDAAAPLLFDVFQELPKSKAFRLPYDDMIEVDVCAKSGHLAGPNCLNPNLEWIPAQGIQSSTCPYHQSIILDATESYQVNASCYPISKMKTVNWFVLPPLMEHYYQLQQPTYRILPPFKQACQSEQQPMEFIFPKAGDELVLPKNVEENTNPFVLKLAHRSPQTKVYWYLDDVYVGETQYLHELSVLPEPGRHVLTVTDEKGHRLQQAIRVARP